MTKIKKKLAACSHTCASVSVLSAWYFNKSFNETDVCTISANIGIKGRIIIYLKSNQARPKALMQNINERRKEKVKVNKDPIKMVQIQLI